jgi:hypothetical protein
VQDGGAEGKRKSRGRHLVGVEDDRHRTVADERNLHPRSEPTSRDGDTLPLERGGKALIQRFRDLRFGGLGEARAVPFSCVE